MKPILIALVIFLLASCYTPRYVYSPVTQNIPLIKKKNDLKIAGYLAGGGSGIGNRTSPGAYNLGLDLHTAYAFSNHFAGMVNKYNRWEQNSSNNDVFAGDSILIRYKRSLTEFGAGYYTNLNDNNSCFQLFGGFAFGRFMINESVARNRTTSGRFHTSNVHKIFIQPAIISGLSKNFTAAFSSRFSMVYYNKISSDYSDAELKEYFLADLSTTPAFFWEPVMSYVFGFKKLNGIKLETQLGITVLMNRRFIDYRTLNVAVGITSDLKFKKVNVKKSEASKEKDSSASPLKR